MPNLDDVGPMAQEKKILKSLWIISAISIGIKRDLSFEQTWVLMTQECFNCAKFG